MASDEQNLVDSQNGILLSVHLPFVLVYFPVTVIKFSDESNIRGGAFSVGHSYRLEPFVAGNQDSSCLHLVRSQEGRAVGVCAKLRFSLTHRPGSQTKKKVLSLSLPLVPHLGNGHNNTS